MATREKKYHIHTFGCQMNVHESEKLAGVLRSLGYSSTDDTKDADIVIFNTCAIRENAEKKIESHIGNEKVFKKQNPNKIVAVCGCMSQQDGRAESLYKKFPFIDIIFGTHNQSSFEEFLKDFLENKKRIRQIDKKLKAFSVDKIHRTSGLNAWVNIMYGCNNFCTYCIVPYVRGREISRPESEIVTEVEGLIKSGYRQITLLGQNVNSYGNDSQDKNINFANLLKKLDSVPGKFRIRFMTSHPKDLSDEVIEVIKNSKNICHGLHLPAQSGSNRILKLMNRKYTREDYMILVEKIKKAMPDAMLTTDIIVGFPGETDEDFEATMELVEQVRFQQIFNFIYSKRSGTAAEKFEDNTPYKTKQARLSRLIARQREIGSEVSLSQVGKTLEVLVEDKKNNQYTGTTDSNKNIRFTSESSEDLIGKFVDVLVTSSRLTVLYGKHI